MTMMRATLLAIIFAHAHGLLAPTRLSVSSSHTAWLPAQRSAARSRNAEVSMLFPWRLASALTVTTASTVVSTVAAVRERRNRQRVEDEVRSLKRNMTSELRLAAALQLRIETELDATKAKRAVAQAYGESMEDKYEREQDLRRKELNAMETEARNNASASAAQLRELQGAFEAEQLAKQRLEEEGRALRQSLRHIEQRAAGERAMLEAEGRALAQTMAEQDAAAEEERRGLEAEAEALGRSLDLLEDARKSERGERAKLEAQAEALSARLAATRQLRAAERVRLEAEAAGLAARVIGEEGERADLVREGEALLARLDASQAAAEEQNPNPDPDPDPDPA
jgi:chromosome segregation ATPase